MLYTKVKVVYRTYFKVNLIVEKIKLGKILKILVTELQYQDSYNSHAMFDRTNKGLFFVL